MDTESVPQDSALPPRDEAYWHSLFKQEEFIAPGPTDNDSEEVWIATEDLSAPRPVSDRPDAGRRDPWLQAQKIADADETLELTIVGHNKGGLLVNWNGLQGFIPASQLIDFPHFHRAKERIQQLKKWVDRTLFLKIIEVDPVANRLILSERATLVDANEREALFQHLEPGEEVEGRVTNLTDFGAFVDLGGVEGLIHISELSWSRVTHPSRILHPGQTVRVKVLDVDEEEERIALSRKQLRRNPWERVEERYEPGQVVEGVVSNVVNFGAFVQLEEELEGLVHISELAEGTFFHPRNVVRKGDNVRARVLHVNGDEKRLALSMRGADLGNGHPYGSLTQER